MADDRHEIRVAVPTRDDVCVQVGNAAAGGRAEIEAHIESIGLQRGGEEAFGENDLSHQRGSLGRRQLFEFRNLAKWNGEEMPGIVGKTIEHEISAIRAMNNESGPIVAEGRKVRERALHPGRIAWRLDVLHAPVSVKLLHFRRKGAQQKPVRGQSQSPALETRVIWFFFG